MKSVEAQREANRQRQAKWRGKNGWVNRKRVRAAYYALRGRAVPVCAGVETVLSMVDPEINVIYEAGEEQAGVRESAAGVIHREVAITEAGGEGDAGVSGVRGGDAEQRAGGGGAEVGSAGTEEEARVNEKLAEMIRRKAQER